MNSPEVRRQIQATATGAKVRHTAPERIRAVRVKLPSTEVQRRVAAVLDNVDSLIENNRRRVEVLELMAHTVYREWFVHFRYPSNNEKAPLIESPLGLLPGDWAARKVDEVARLVRGRSYRTTELVENGGLSFINLKCMMRGGGFRRDGLKEAEAINYFAVAGLAVAVPGVTV
jgi:type I restriction enzyme S subunit